MHPYIRTLVFNRRMVHVLWNGYKLHGLSEKKLENWRGISQGEEIQTLEISCTLRKMGIGQVFEIRINWRKPQGKFDIRLLLRYFSLDVVRLKFCATTFATLLSILKGHECVDAYLHEKEERMQCSIPRYKACERFDDISFSLCMIGGLHAYCDCSPCLLINFLNRLLMCLCIVRFIV